MQPNQQPASKPAPRTAAQRLDDLERAVMSLYQTADQMVRDMGVQREAIKLLSNKMDAIVKASNRGEALTDDVIAKIMVENNVEELKTKVTDLVNQGVLVAAEEVTAGSFVAGRELAEDGTVQNPRIQFVVSQLQENVRNKMPGAKVGQVLDLEDGKWKFEVQEIYSIETPKAPVPPENPQAETPGPADDGSQNS